MRWAQKPADSAQINSLAIALVNSFLKKDTKAAPTLARLLVNRGITTAESAEIFLLAGNEIFTEEPSERASISAGESVPANLPLRNTKS